ncbi:CoA transferase [Sphingobium aromaticiconvertens]|uniref:CoA transferase n=1 Tax=Sphingobium aromaticiconvertens TaxID=365341 RepID=UPI00301AC263
MNKAGYLAAPYGIYRTADGHMALAMAPVDRLGALIDCADLTDFAPNRWFADRDAIKARLRDHLVGQSTAHWLSRLEPAGIWAAPVLDWPTLIADPGFAALDAVQSVTSPDGASLSLTRCPIRIDGRIIKNERAAPRLGADSQAIQSDITGAA